jgi:hypothetical protein
MQCLFPEFWKYPVLEADPKLVLDQLHIKITRFFIRQSQIRGT